MVTGCLASLAYRYDILVAAHLAVGLRAVYSWASHALWINVCSPNIRIGFFIVAANNFASGNDSDCDYVFIIELSVRNPCLQFGGNSIYAAVVELNYFARPIQFIDEADILCHPCQFHPVLPAAQYNPT